MKRATLFLITLLFITIPGIGCLEPQTGGGEIGDQKSVITASSAGQGGGEPLTGPFVVNITLSEPPLINKTVTATIGVHNTGSTIDNASIRLRLYRRLSPYNWWERKLVWEKVLWTGTMPGNGDAMASGPLMIEEPGYFYASGWAFEIHPTYTPFNEVYLFLNASENRTIVVPGKGPLEPQPPPPPTIPYVIKIDLDGVPALNRPVNLRVTIASLMDQKNATFKIFLPEGFELVSGDLVWQGDLQKGMDATEIGGPGVTKDKIPEATLQRIPEGKKVRMRATIKARLIGDARVIVFPAPDLPVGDPADIGCYVNGFGLGIPHPEGGGWQAVSYGGCLNVRVINETDGIFSEQKLPFLPRPQKTRSPTPPG